MEYIDRCKIENRFLVFERDKIATDHHSKNQCYALYFYFVEQNLFYGKNAQYFESLKYYKNIIEKK